LQSVLRELAELDREGKLMACSNPDDDAIRQIHTDRRDGTRHPGHRVPRAADLLKDASLEMPNAPGILLEQSGAAGRCADDRQRKVADALFEVGCG